MGTHPTPCSNNEHHGLLDEGNPATCTYRRSSTAECERSAHLDLASLDNEPRAENGLI